MSFRFRLNNNDFELKPLYIEIKLLIIDMVNRETGNFTDPFIVTIFLLSYKIQYNSCGNIYLGTLLHTLNINHPGRIKWIYYNTFQFNFVLILATLKEYQIPQVKCSVPQGDPQLKL